MNTYNKPNVYLSGFIALGVALGYALSAVPGVELVTATIFVCGYIMGVRYGILCGLTTEALYGILNYQGAPPFLLLLGMILAMALTGTIGGLLGRMNKGSDWSFNLSLAAAGFICTLNFTLLCTLGDALNGGYTGKELLIYIITGIPFSVIHLSVNTIIFFTLVPLIMRWIPINKKVCLTVAGLLIIALPSRALEYNENLESAYTIHQVPLTNYRHLGDLVKNLPGVQYRDLGYNGNWAGFWLSGSRSNQAQLLINGFSMIDPITNQSDLRCVPVEMVEQITTSPNDVDIDRISLGGSVAVKTRSLNTSTPYSKVVYRTGPNRFSDLDLTFGQQYTQNLKILSGVLLNNEGDEGLYKHHGQHIRSSVLWQPLKPLSLSYLILHNVSASDLTCPISIPQDTSITTYPNLKRQRVDHMLRSTFHAGQWPVQLSWHFSDLLYRFSDRFSEKREAVKGSRHEWTLEQHLPFLSDCSWYTRYEIQSVNMDPIRAHQKIFEAGIQNRYALTDHLSSDIRIVYHHGMEKTCLGTGKLVWTPEPWFRCWSGFSRMVREPCASEKAGLIINPSPPENRDALTLLHFLNRIKKNPAIRDEFSHTWDLGIQVKQSVFQIFLRGFVQQSSNLLKLEQQEDAFMFKNTSEQQNYGLETQAWVGPWNRFKGSLTLNYLHATEEGATMFERPNFRGFATIAWSYPFFKNDIDLHIVIQTQFWSDFYSISGYTLETFYNQYHPFGQLLHGKIMAQIMKNAVISISIDNILDAHIALINGFQLPGRSVRVEYYWELFD